MFYEITLPVFSVCMFRTAQPVWSDHFCLDVYFLRYWDKWGMGTPLVSWLCLLSLCSFLHPAIASILKVSVCFLQVAQRWILFSYPIHYSVYFEWAIETVNIQSYYWKECINSHHFVDFIHLLLPEPSLAHNRLSTYFPSGSLWGLFNLFFSPK